MGSLNEANPSLWVGTSERATAGPGDLPRRVDVAVVGAGITGLTTARLIAAEGATVAVIEAGEVCSGVTAYTSAKVSALQRTTISEIRDRLGGERAAVYAEANRAAVEHIAQLVDQDAIDCDLERASACTYTETEDEIAAVEAEHDAAQAAGLSTRLDSSTELPLQV